MKTILLVEDNPDHALLIRRAIEDGESKVLHCTSAEEALSWVESGKIAAEKPALALFDLKLPGLDGHSLLERFRKMNLQIPVLILTTSGRAEDVTKAYQLGACGYVVKTDDFNEFKAKLKQVKEYWFHTVELPYTGG